MHNKSDKPVLSSSVYESDSTKGRINRVIEPNTAEHALGLPDQVTTTETPQELLFTVWKKIVDNSDTSTRAFISGAQPVMLHGSTLVIEVPHEFTRERIETRLRSELEESLSQELSQKVRLAVTVNPDLELVSAEPEPETHQLVEPIVEDTVSLNLRPHINSSANQPARASDRLNPKYTFETFVIGSSNRFAHAAAVAVAEAPGKAYNPLMIYGDSGLGKTHLLHALGHYVRHYYSRARVRYVSTEELTNDFINAVKDNKTSQFRSFYRDVDVLLIDDIQFLESKIQTQEEFFHTFNALHADNKQIVMTSDRPPKALEALEPRLRSRFEWGLLTDVQPPDLETRIAILRKKAAAERLTAGPDVLEFIASKIQSNIRELEGALIRVTAFASLNRQEVDLGLAEIVLKDLIPEGGEAQITAPQIMAATAAYFGITIDDMCGQSRTQALVMARQIAMYLCRELTDLSLPKIGAQFGGRDHTTVMHADKKVRQMLSERRSVYNQITELTNRIKQQANQH